VDSIRFGLGVRALRRRRRWSQDALAGRAGLSRSVIGRIERGQADRVTVRTLGRVTAELGARIDVRLLWHAEGLDRLLDARHAALVDQLLAMLGAEEWVTAAEVSFNIRGERGSVDILAFHPPTSSLLVVEVKSVVPDLQASSSRSIGREGSVARLGENVVGEQAPLPGSWCCRTIEPLDAVLAHSPRRSARRCQHELSRFGDG